MCDFTSTSDPVPGAKEHHGTWPPNTEGRWKAKGHQEPSHGSPEVSCPSTFTATEKAKAHDSTTRPGLELSQTQSRPSSQHLEGGLSIHVPVRLKWEPESQVQCHTHGFKPSLLACYLGSEPPRTGSQRPKPQRGCHKRRGSLYSKTSSGMSLGMCVWLPVEDRKQQIRAGQTARLSSYCCVGTFSEAGRESQGK